MLLVVLNLVGASEAIVGTLVLVMPARLGCRLGDFDDIESMYSYFVISRRIDEVIHSWQSEQGHRENTLAGTISWKHLTHAVCEHGFSKKYIG